MQELSTNVTIDDMDRQRIYINDKNRLLERATPKRGTVTYVGNAQDTVREKEVVTIDWLHNNIGGNINVLPENNPDGTPNPDLLWNNILVDIKHTSGNLGTLNWHVQKAMGQTNNGGVIIDVTNTRFSNKDVIDTVTNRLRERRGTFALILKDNEIMAYIEEK